MKSISYAHLVVPLIKAVQEQQTEIESLKAANTKLRDDVEALKARH